VARRDGIAAMPLLMRALRRCEQDGRGSDKLTVLIAQLIKMYPPQASKVLYQMAADHAPLIRRDAAWALGLLAEEYSESPLLHLLNDSHPSVRVAAANALKRFKTENVANALVTLMRDPDAQVRATVVIALGHIGNYYCLPALHAAINDPAEIVRNLAADALKRLGFQSPTNTAAQNRSRGFKFNLFGAARNA
jgi:HEAT repeat protein